MSRASTSGVSRAKAFLEPSGLSNISTCTGGSGTPRGFIFIPDESVDLDGLDVVQLLEGLLDLTLVRLDIHDENQGVVLLDLLHGALGVEGVQDDLVGVEARSMGDGLAGVLGRPGELEGLGAVEGGRGADLAGFERLQ
jgi:hypothetical protein